MLYYDCLKKQPLPENLHALKVLLSTQIPVFKIRYKPREHCEHHAKFVEETMRVSTDQYTVPISENVEVS